MQKANHRIRGKNSLSNVNYTISYKRNVYAYIIDVKRYFAYLNCLKYHPKCTGEESSLMHRDSKDKYISRRLPLQ